MVKIQQKLQIPKEKFTKPEDRFSSIKNAQNGLSTNFRILPKTIDQLRPEGMKQKSYRGVLNHGKSESWYNDGQKREEIDYKYGDFVGHWTVWHDNGQMAQDITYNDDGEFDGTLRWWYFNGTLSQVSHYSNGEVLTEKGFDEAGKCIQGDCAE